MRVQVGWFCRGNTTWWFGGLAEEEEKRGGVVLFWWFDRVNTRGGSGLSYFGPGGIVLDQTKRVYVGPGLGFGLWI